MSRFRVRRGLAERGRGCDSGNRLLLLLVLPLREAFGVDAVVEEEIPREKDASDVVLRTRRRFAATLGVNGSAGVRPVDVNPPFKAGIISLASSLTSTAGSRLLSFSTTVTRLNLSTTVARSGCTSQITRSILSRLNLTTAFPDCPSLSTIRAKNSGLDSETATVLDVRRILRKGSSRLSKEFVLAATKHFKRRARHSGLVTLSSTRAVSSCNLEIFYEKQVFLTLI